MEYGRSQEEAHHKKFRFTLTTNGVLLNDEVMEFCNREMSNVVLSLDGRPEVNEMCIRDRCTRSPRTPTSAPWWSPARIWKKAGDRSSACAADGYLLSASQM